MSNDLRDQANAIIETARIKPTSTYQQSAKPKTEAEKQEAIRDVCRKASENAAQHIAHLQSK